MVEHGRGWCPNKTYGFFYFVRLKLFCKVKVSNGEKEETELSHVLIDLLSVFSNLSTRAATS